MRVRPRGAYGLIRRQGDGGSLVFILIDEELLYLIESYYHIRFIMHVKDCPRHWNDVGKYFDNTLVMGRRQWHQLSHFLSSIKTSQRRIFWYFVRAYNVIFITSQIGPLNNKYNYGSPANLEII